MTEDLQQFTLQDFIDATHNLNLNERKFNAEAVYQKLLEKQPNLNKDEQIVFALFKHTRDLYLKIEDKRKNYLPELNIKDFENFNTTLMYYDWNGYPIDQWEWSLKLNFFPKHLGDELVNGWRVSTIWLGSDHSFWKNHAPIIFETMVFKEDKSIPDNEFYEGYQERYSTLEEAEYGHKSICDAIRNGTLETLNQEDDE